MSHVPPATLGDAIEAEKRELNKCWVPLLAWGVLLAVLGLAAILYPALATVDSMLVFGILMLLAGGSQMATAFLARAWRGVLLSIQCGALYLVAGVAFLDNPMLAAAVLTLLLAMMYLASGITRVSAALAYRFEGWPWMALGGAASILLGVLIWKGYPGSTYWVLGLFIGLDLLSAGLSWIMIALGVRRPPSPAIS